MTPNIAIKEASIWVEVHEKDCNCVWAYTVQVELLIDEKHQQEKERKREREVRTFG